MPATRSTVRSGSSTRRWAAGWPSARQLGLYPGRARHQHGGARPPDAAARRHRRRPGRSRRAGARHAVGDAAARAAGLCRSRTTTTGSRKAVPAKAQPLGVTALLVGAGVGGLPIAEQRRGAAAGGAGGPAALGANGLRELEVLELVEDRANPGLARARPSAAGQPSSSGRFELDPAVKVTSGGRRNVSGDDDPSWWQPIQITMEEVGGERVMRYVTTAGRARAEASLVPGNTGFVERFVAQATGTAARTRQAASPPAAPCSSCSGPSGSRRPAARTATCAWWSTRGRRPSPGSCWTTAGPGWRPASADGGGEPPKPAAVRSRPGPPARADASSARRSWRPRACRRALVVGDPRAEPRARLRRRCPAPRRRPAGRRAAQARAATT